MGAGKGLKSLGKDARLRARINMRKNRKKEDDLTELDLTELDLAEDALAEEPLEPIKKKPSRVWRITRIVLIVLGSIILALILAVGIFLYSKYKRFNEDSYVTGATAIRSEPYVRPETEEPIYELSTDENGEPIVETDANGNYYMPGFEFEPMTDWDSETGSAETLHPNETRTERETIAPPSWSTSPDTSSSATLEGETAPGGDDSGAVPSAPGTDFSETSGGEVTPGDDTSVVEPPINQPTESVTDPGAVPPVPDTDSPETSGGEVTPGDDTSVPEPPVGQPTEPVTDSSTSPSVPDTDSPVKPPVDQPTEPATRLETVAPTTPATEPPTEPDTEPETEPIPEQGFYKNASDGHLYFYKDGKPYTDGLFLYEGKYYFARSTGWLVRGTTYYIDDGKDYFSPGPYVFDSDGAIVRRSGNEQTIGSFRNNYDILDVYGNVPIYRETQQDSNVKNILLLGTDSRDLSQTRGNSDVMIVISINQKTDTVKLVSILRDTLVPIEGYDYDRINAAYNCEGAGLAVNTVNEAFGLDIQEFIIIDFNGVIDLIDYIGGVEVTLMQAEADYYNETFPTIFPDKLTEGKVHLDSLQALTHIRNRKLGTDFERTRRQKDVMVAIMNKIIRDQSLAEMNDTLNFVLKLIRTNISATDFVSVGLSLVGGMNSGMQTTQVPAGNDEYVWAVYKGMLILKPSVKGSDGTRMDISASLDAIAKRLKQFLYS